MKNNISKSIMLGISCLLGASLIVGNVFASNIVTSANELVIPISIKGVDLFYLYNSKTEERLSLNYNASSHVVSIPTGEEESFEDIALESGDILKVQKQATGASEYIDVKSFTCASEGTYDFADSDLDDTNLNVTQVGRAVYVYSNHKTKGMPNAYFHAWKDGGTTVWPGYEMSLVHMEESSQLFRALIDPSYTDAKVNYAYSYELTEYRSESANLIIPSGDRPTYRIGFENDAQTGWTSYPTSYSSTYSSTFDTSNVYIVGTLNGWTQTSNYSFNYLATLDGGKKLHVITVTMKKDDEFKVRQGDTWLGWNQGLSNYTDLFTNASGENPNAKVLADGTYVIYAILEGSYSNWVVGASKLAVAES